jgi:deoxycytidylate deaminase
MEPEPKKHSLFAQALDKRGRLISTGVNSYHRSRALQRYFAIKVGMPESKYTHAEIDALVNARGKQVHKLIISRYNKAGEPACAKPCKICAEAIKAFGVKVVEHT